MKFIKAAAVSVSLFMAAAAYSCGKSDSSKRLTTSSP